MDNHKMEIMCHLNEIGVMICKLKDGKKLDHCDKKVKDLHSYLKRKKKSRSKTMRKPIKSKSIKSKSISNVFSISDKPFMDDMDKSVPHLPSMSPPMHPAPHSTPHSISSPPVNTLSEPNSMSASLSESGSYEPTESIYSVESKPSNFDTSKYNSLNLNN